jgi:carboxyl-terminal processing protease
MIEPGTGLVRVSDFTPATAEDVRTELAALERAGAERLLLDLRSAAWGPNEAGARLAELFLPGGPVAKVVGRRAEDRLLEADPARTAWTKPLVVLVDNGTAGPGEIAAAALLDAGRGPLVGRRTFGRAAVSKAVPLPEGALLLTVAKYMSPKGTSIHGEGVQPTVAVASAREEDDEDRPEGEAAPDRVLEKGLEVVRAEVAKARG